MKPRILILGATGSIGRAIHQAGLADAGVTAVAGLRRVPPGFLGEHRVADATNLLQLGAAFAGMTHVINAVGGSPDVLRRNAVAVCAAARGMSGLHVIHISSMAVYGDATGLVAEEAPLRPNGAYAAAKIAAEREFHSHAPLGVKATILRPGIVQGPNSAQWTKRLGRLLAAGRLGDLGEAGDGFCNLIDERDLAAACLSACRLGAAGIFNIGLRSPPTWNAYLTELACHLGHVPVRRIGARRLAWEARVLAPVLAAGGRVVGRDRLPDAISPSLLRLFAQRIRLDVSRSEAVLGPAVSSLAAE